MTNCVLPIAPTQARVRIKRPFEVHIGDLVIGGDGSEKSFKTFFDQLPADIARRMLRRGAESGVWESGLDDMVGFDAPPGTHLVRLDFVETEEGGDLYHAGTRTGPRAFIWCIDLDLTIVWAKAEYHTRWSMPVSELANEFFADAMPVPARAWWQEMGGTEDSFDSLVRDLIGRPPLDAWVPVTNVRIEFDPAAGTVVSAVGCEVPAAKLMAYAAKLGVR